MTKQYTNKSVLVFLPSQDFNEQEYLVTKDELEKEGCKVFIASDSNSLCVGSQGLKVKNDVNLFNVHVGNFGGFIIVGGKGTRNYWNNASLIAIVKKFAQSKKTIGAICSAPIILAKAGILCQSAACYPDDKKELLRYGVEFNPSAVVSKNKVITGKDPASSTEFIKAFLYELTKN